jgi:asparagine synthase (glutamine-hydrolysing)
VRDIAAGVCLDGGPLDLARLRILGGSDCWRDGEVGLATSPCSGPTADPSLVVDSDRRLTLVWDGRLDACGDLLQSRETRPSSDAVLVLGAYADLGIGVLELLSGDFAFLLWDASRRTLFAVRDHFGVRPLHYALVGQTCWLASRVAQLRRLPQVGRTIDEETLGRFFAGALSNGESTFFEGINRVGAGHVLEITRGAVRQRPYWDPQLDRGRAASENGPLIETLREHLSRAVEDRVRGARRVGLLLSGGLDSAAVACAIADLGVGGVASFTATFDTPRTRDRRSRTQPLNEKYGFDGHHSAGDASWTFRDLPGTCSDEPLEGMYVGSVRRLLDSARAAGIDVVLTGYGGDAMLGGNAYYLLDLALARQWAALLSELRSYPPSRRWSLLSRYVAKPLLLGRPAKRSAPRMPGWVSTRLNDAAALSRDARAERRGELRGLSRRVEFAAQALPHQAARMLWYHDEAFNRALELRHPFFDRRLYEFLLTVPVARKISDGRRKALLRSLLAGRLPSAAQTPDAASDGTLSRGAVLARERSEWNATFLDARCVEIGYVDRRRVMKAFDRYQKGDSLVTYDLARTYRVERWLKRL